MNIPNRISMNRRFDPRNFQCVKTYPLIDPRNTETTTAGIVMIKLLRKYGPRPVKPCKGSPTQAAANPLSEKLRARRYMVLTETVSKLVIDAFTMT